MIRPTTLDEHLTADHADKYPSLPPAPPASRQAVQGVVIVPSGADVGYWTPERLTLNIQLVAANMKALEGYTFDVPPVIVHHSSQPVDYFNNSGTFHGHTWIELGEVSVPTIGIVVGVSHDYGASNTRARPHISIGGTILPSVLPNVIKHELGHLIMNSTGHPSTPPWTITTSYRSPPVFGPLVTETKTYYDIMGLYQKPGQGLACFNEPIEYTAFTPGVVSYWLPQAQFLRRV